MKRAKGQENTEMFVLIDGRDSSVQSRGRAPPIRHLGEHVKPVWPAVPNEGRPMRGTGSRRISFQVGSQIHRSRAECFGGRGSGFIYTERQVVMV